MDRMTLFALTAGASLLNGLFSPFAVLIQSVAPVWFPNLLMEPSLGAVVYLSALILATLTLLLSGVVAAVFERVTNRDPYDPATGWVWLGAAVVLTLPSAPVLLTM